MKKKCCFTDLLKQNFELSIFLEGLKKKNTKISVMTPNVPCRDSKRTRHGCASRPSQLANWSYRLDTWESRLTSTRRVVRTLARWKVPEISAVRQVHPAWHMSLSVLHSGTYPSVIVAQSTPSNCYLFLWLQGHAEVSLLNILYFSICYIRLTLNICSFVRQCNTFTS
jgi:hypothetical protein